MLYYHNDSFGNYLVKNAILIPTNCFGENV